MTPVRRAGLIAVLDENRFTGRKCDKTKNLEIAPLHLRRAML